MQLHLVSFSTWSHVIPLVYKHLEFSLTEKMRQLDRASALAIITPKVDQTKQSKTTDNMSYIIWERKDHGLERQESHYEEIQKNGRIDRCTGDTNKDQFFFSFRENHLEISR